MVMKNFRISDSQSKKKSLKFCCFKIDYMKLNKKKSNVKTRNIKYKKSIFYTIPKSNYINEINLVHSQASSSKIHNDKIYLNNVAKNNKIDNNNYFIDSVDNNSKLSSNQYKYFTESKAQPNYCVMHFKIFNKSDNNYDKKKFQDSLKIKFKNYDFYENNNSNRKNFVKNSNSFSDTNKIQENLWLKENCIFETRNLSLSTYNFKDSVFGINESHIIRRENTNFNSEYD